LTCCVARSCGDRDGADSASVGGSCAWPDASCPRSAADGVAQRGAHPVDGLLRRDALLALVGHEDEHDGGRRPLRGAGGHRDRVEADYRWRARVPWRPDPAAQREVPGRGSRDADLLRPGGAGASAPFSVNRRSMESAIALEADSTWSRESPGRTPLIPDSVRKEKPLSGQYPGSAIALAVVRNPEPQSEPPSDPWVPSGRPVPGADGSVCSNRSPISQSGGTE